MPLKEVDVKSLNISPFTAIGDDWMLVTAGDQDSHNTKIGRASCRERVSSPV